MNKLLILIILIVGLSFSEDIENPTGKIEASDELNPQQDEKDFKTWINMLKWYKEVRETAKGHLQTLGAVTQFAYAAHKELAAIESAAQNVEQVIENIENFSYDNPIQTIKFLEEDVFQKTDYLYQYQIPNIRDLNDERVEKRDIVARRLRGHFGALLDIMDNAWEGFTERFYHNQQLARLDDRSTQTDKLDDDKRTHAIITTVAAKSLAESDVESIKARNSEAQLRQIMNSMSSEASGNKLNQADMNYVNNRNRTIMGIDDIKRQGELTTNLSWTIIAQAKSLERSINNRAILRYQSSEMSLLLDNFAKREQEKRDKSE